MTGNIQYYKLSLFSHNVLTTSKEPRVWLSYIGFCIREMLFKNGNFSLTRSDLQCLCPGQNIDPKVGLGSHHHTLVIGCIFFCTANYNKLYQILMSMSIKTSWT